MGVQIRQTNSLPPGMTRRRCGFLPNYFEHLFSPGVFPPSLFHLSLLSFPHLFLVPFFCEAAFSNPFRRSVGALYDLSTGSVEDSGQKPNFSCFSAWKVFWANRSESILKRRLTAHTERRSSAASQTSSRRLGWSHAYANKMTAYWSVGVWWCSNGLYWTRFCQNACACQFAHSRHTMIPAECRLTDTCSLSAAYKPRPRTS